MVKEEEEKEEEEEEEEEKEEEEEEEEEMAAVIGRRTQPFMEQERLWERGGWEGAGLGRSREARMGIWLRENTREVKGEERKKRRRKGSGVSLGREQRAGRRREDEWGEET
ncbi:hypothetical protein E2C01_096175 [Portunus trituberculatus]|uniref:Uncharacterized protein n=1 Tax=Portunus trituberculatus TaxID=210409 RepID=A0A5B7K7K4_PORTR|nr:hypothetical protein [Portunus trituberculatus]